MPKNGDILSAKFLELELLSAFIRWVFFIVYASILQNGDQLINLGMMMRILVPRRVSLLL